MDVAIKIAVTKKLLPVVNDGCALHAFISTLSQSSYDTKRHQLRRDFLPSYLLLGSLILPVTYTTQNYSVSLPDRIISGLDCSLF